MALSWLSGLSEKAQKMRDQMRDEMKRYKNKDLMEAIVAGCAMVAAADGSIGSDEKSKMMGYLRSSDEMKVYDTDTVIKTFNKYAGQFEFDTGIGTGEAMKVIGKFKDKPEAQLIVRVCCAIGASDGNFDDDEKKVVRRMASELGLNPADFDL